jgi:diguanylate cyclase (GGDEF)-like protein
VKLRTKFLLLLGPLLGASLVAVGVLGYNALRRTSEENTFEQMRHVVDQVSGVVNTLVRTATANAELFSHHLIVEQYVLSSPEERYALLQRPLLRTFRAFQAAYPEYYELRIILPDGTEDARWTHEPIANATEDESGQPLFLRLQESQAATALIERNADDGRMVLHVATPLMLREAGAPATSEPLLHGYLAMTVTLDSLSAALGTTRITPTHMSFVTDVEGRVLLESQPGRLGADLPPDLFAKLRAGADGGRLVEADLAGERHYFRGAQAQPGVFLFTALPRAELLASSDRLRERVTPIVLGAIAITLGLLFIAFHRLVVAPLRALEIVVQRIGEGDLNVSVEGHSQDEIGELARAFGEMSRNLGESHEQIRQLAYHDGLTGLPNRRSFNEQLEKAVSYARRHEETFAVLFVDFDNFKRINDTVGHQAADALLRQLSEALGEIIRGDDVLALSRHAETESVVSRVGGDEFVVLLPHTRDRFSPGIVARRILEQLGNPIRVADQELFVTASIGIATFPEDGETGDVLVRNADTAMYHAKQQGKASYQYYSHAMNVASVKRLTLETALRRALEQERLELHYQPVVDLTTRRIVGAEALLRWNDPQLGYISPATFIPLAEESGLILPIGEWVIQRGCQQAQQWRRDGLPEIPVSVNVSAVQFSRQNLCGLVTRALDSSGLHPALLGIEITESALMSVRERAVELLEQLRALGVRLALDDFGTGYSSLSYLRRFPISTLKIDRSFVSEIPANSHTASITEAIISMAHVLGLRVVAEGVEQGPQIDLLEGWGCDAVQGFYYSAAVPAAKFAEMLASTHLGVRPDVRLQSEQRTA